MIIDFQPILMKEKNLLDLASGYTQTDLIDTLNWYIDFTMNVVVNTTSDKQATDIPIDPHADDPYAASEEERHMGWSLVHLVTHITASAEEGAAFSSILARGIAISGRLRKEYDWRRVTTRTFALQRLEECRRICLGYLATWPDQPDFSTLRIMPEHLNRLKANAPVSFVYGLLHWYNHIEQIQNASGQVRETIYR